MAANIRKVTESLSCPVCLRIFKNPKYLPCYHSYCAECLEKLQSQSEIKCPECREVAKVPEGGVKSLPINFLINSLVDELIFKSKVEGEEVQCENCDENDPVVSYCPNCNLFLCHICNESHKRDRRSINHIQDLIPFTELKSGTDVPVCTKVKTLMCEKHNLELAFYCETCEDLVCLYCTTTKQHSGHVHDAVKQLAGKHRQELSTITTPIKGTIDSLSNACENLNKVAGEIQKCGSEVEKDIDRHYDEIIQNLVNQKEEMKQHLQHKVAQKTKIIKTQIEELKGMKTEISNINELKEAIEKSSDQQMLSAKKEVVNRLLRAMNKYSIMDFQPLQSATMEFIPTKEPLQQFGQLFTQIDPSATELANLPQYAFVGQTIDFTINTKYYTYGQYCHKGGSQVVVQLKYGTKGTMFAQVKDNHDGSYTASFAPEQVGEVMLLVSINGLKVTENPYTFVVRKTYLAVSKPSNIVDNGGNMGRPWGIAFGQNEIWAVTDSSKHCVYVFDKHNELIVKIGSRSGRFHYPYGVAFDASNHLYVADGGNHRVQKFDAMGNYLLQFGSKGASDGHLHNPHGVTICGDKIYVADCNNNRISVFQTTNGEFCHVIGKGHLDAPYDLFVNTNNLLLVVDHDQHCVCTFTLEGEFVSKFGSKGKHWGQLNEPCSIVTDLHDSIIVTDSGNHCILIFDKDGNCINCIGSVVGSSPGEFNSPCGVALSANGSIYINDSANKRIQVFSTF